MGLDGVGRGAAPGAALPPVEAQNGAKTFQVPTEPNASPPAVASVTRVATGATPLERWRAGEIDREAYLDLKVDEASAHLQGLRPEELDGVKTVLRGQLANDPTLGDLVRRVTGED